jgi:hypothetical protein
MDKAKYLVIPSLLLLRVARCRKNVFVKPLPSNNRIRIDTETHRQQDDLISLLLLFRSSESRLKTNQVIMKERSTRKLAKGSSGRLLRTR